MVLSSNERRVCQVLKGEGGKRREEEDVNIIVFLWQLTFQCGIEESDYPIVSLLTA